MAAYLFLSLVIQLPRQLYNPVFRNWGNIALVAQLVEHGSNKPRVGGSSPLWSTQDFFFPLSVKVRMTAGMGKESLGSIILELKLWAHSSAVEHGIADPAVTGSIPVAPFFLVAFCPF